MTTARPANRQGRPRKWGDHCRECGNPSPRQSMRHGWCGTCYQRGRRAGTITTSYVDPEPARAHLATVYATGVSYRWIAAQAGTSTVNLNNVAHRKRARISRELADKILSVPVPTTVNDRALRQRALQTAGMRGLYVGVERRYRQDRARRRVPYHKRDHLRHSRKKQFLSEREEFLEWLYAGMPTEPAQVEPVVRTVNWDTVTCGDCEHRPCACINEPHDCDLWIPVLADHDEPFAVELKEAA